MTMQRKLIRADISAVGDDEVEVVMSTAALARDGHVLIPQGCVLDNYRANPIVLWSHDPEHPLGNADNIVVGSEQITARVQFAPLGISHKADEIRGLTKAGVIRAVSVGFNPIDGEPLDPKKPRGGQRFTEWELLELSFVSVPSDTGAVVTARANGDETVAEATENDLHVEIKVANGKAVAEAISAAAPPARKRSARKAKREFAVKFPRGLYQVAELCWLFEELGWHVDMAEWETSVEGDGSKVPAMLASIFQDLGDALLAMTQEEIAEALAGHDIEPDDGIDDGLMVEEREHIRAATAPGVRAFRRGLAQAKIRAGKTLSEETVRCLRDAQALHEEAAELHRSAMRKHKDGMAAVDDLMTRAGVSDPESDATQTVQTSDGTDVSGGTENGRMSADFRRRQADLLAISAFN